ncbi:hypothetical protein CAJAP_00088 [Camponotus japonicus]
MPMACSVKGCKSLWKKHSKITFHRFPPKNENYFKYWIAATGIDNLVSNARVCSLHFIDNDYFTHTKHVNRKFLKPDVFPTQHVHKNIIQMLQDKGNKINKYDKNDTPSHTHINEEQNDKLIDEEEANISKLMSCSLMNKNDKPINEEANQNNVMFIDEQQVEQNDVMLIDE